MADPTISSVQLDLNSYKIYDPNTATEVMRTAQANVYTVSTVTEADGITPRKLSIAELVMVVCLARAAEKEAAVIALMREMSDTTAILEGLTDIESKLLAGYSVASITDMYTYQGMKYSAEDFLAIVLGGAPASSSSTHEEEMITLWNLLNNHPLMDVTGSFTYAGTTYTKAYEFLNATGMPYMSPSEATLFYSLCSYADGLPDGYVLTDSEVIDLSGQSALDNLWMGMTKEDVCQGIDSKYNNDDLRNYVQTLGWSSGTGHVPNASSYIPSDKDQLITEIESKMDSLNSFSQQKMIELQSETNKRDQAYDMITNILKSLNTVQIGIANNI